MNVSPVSPRGKNGRSRRIIQLKRCHSTRQKSRVLVLYHLSRSWQNSAQSSSCPCRARLGDDAPHTHTNSFPPHVFSPRHGYMHATRRLLVDRRARARSADTTITAPTSALFCSAAPRPNAPNPSPKKKAGAQAKPAAAAAAEPPPKKAEPAKGRNKRPKKGAEPDASPKPVQHVCNKRRRAQR